MNGKLINLLDIKSGNLDQYFQLLKEYFSTFDFSKLKKKKISGNQFKL